MKLKALVFSLVLTALSVGQVSAQKIALGLEGGANFANFIGSDVTASSLTQSRLGLVGGAFLDLYLGTSLAIRPEILYSQKGGKDTSNNTLQLDYVEIPVLLKLCLGTPGFNPGILAGPSFSFNTVAQVVNSGGSSSSINSVNAADIGVILGAEVEIEKFFVTGRYELGLTNVQNAVNGVSSNVQNGLITLMIGVSFI